MFRPIVTAAALLAFVASQLVAVSAHAHCAATLSGHGPEARPHIHWGLSGHTHNHPHDHRHVGEHPRGEHGERGTHGHSHEPPSQTAGGVAAERHVLETAAAWSPQCAACTQHDADVVYLVSEVSAAVRCGTERSASSAPQELATAPAAGDCGWPVDHDEAASRWAASRENRASGKLFLKLRNLRI
jgi:hypothetical protein